MPIRELAFFFFPRIVRFLRKEEFLSFNNFTKNTINTWMVSLEIFFFSELLILKKIEGELFNHKYVS